MSASIGALLLAAGLAAGLSGTMTGIGSLFSYPALLAVGLPPTAANVTNTVSLAVGGFGGIHGSRPELVGQARTVRRLAIVCVLGSAAGSGLLLASPPGVFQRVVPFLVGGASVLILLPRPGFRRTGLAGSHSRGRGFGKYLGMGAVALYNGYFAAGSGMLMIVVLLASTAESLLRINALKNVLVVLVDLVAAVSFALFGPVSWSSAVWLMTGMLVGARLGPVVARRLPTTLLRGAVALAGMGLAIKLGIDAW